MKTPKKDSEHSREREFTVVLEDIQSQFRVFGEGLGDVSNRLERVEDQLVKLDTIERDVSFTKIDIRSIKTSFQPFVAQVSDHETRITAIEHSR